MLVRLKGFITGAAAVAMLCAITGATARAQAPAGQGQALQVKAGQLGQAARTAAVERSG